MGRLVSEAGRCCLGARHLIGRQAHVDLQLASSTVSKEHASVYFDGEGWKIRDLGSRNGTFLNGQRLELRRSVPLVAGDELRFGGMEEPSWVLESSQPPVPVAHARDGRVVEGDPRGLWLPNPDEPSVFVKRVDRGWVIDDPSASVPTNDGATLEVDGTTWHLELPSSLQPEVTDHLSTAESTDEPAATLLFCVSQDEEHVELRVELVGETLALGARAYNYALLVLARHQLQDVGNGILGQEQGWMHTQDLRDRLRLDRQALNVQLWRAAQNFSKLGLCGKTLIERRVDSSQVRLGLPCRVE